MSKYVDVEWLKTEFDEANEIYFFYLNADSREAFEELKKIVEQAPTIERAQGEWIIEIDVNGNTYGRCSICGMRQYAGQLNFCPDCGALNKFKKYE